MKILLAFHHFGLNSDIVSAALSQAQAFKARLHLVTSMETGEDIPKDEFDFAEENLERGKNFFREHGVDCVTALLETGNNAGEDLVEYASKNDIDVMIVGVKSRSRLGKLLFGSTAQYVILQAPCPVLTVKQ